MPKPFQAFIAALVGIAIDVLVALISAGLQQKSFFEQMISAQGLWILIVLVILCLIISILLDKFKQDSSSRPSTPPVSNGIIISGSTFVGSETELKGKGIQVIRSRFFRSKNKVDTSN